MKKQAKSQAVTIAASSAGAVAKRFDAEQSGSKLVRALLSGGKFHAVISDGKSTLDVMDGSVALSVAQAEEEE
jgi:hypothetical protein